MTARVIAIVLSFVLLDGLAARAADVPRDPIAIKACEIATTGPNGRRAEGRMSAAQGTVHLAFVNSATVAAKEVRIAFMVNGLIKTEGTYRGTYAPAASIDFAKTTQSALAPITDPQGLSCSVTFVKFEDGTEWRPEAARGSIQDDPTSPIRIVSCSVQATGGDNTNSRHFYATTSFENRSDRDVYVVRFRISFIDPFDAPLSRATYTVTGHYSPHALIEPSRNANGSFVYNPSSPAWLLTSFTGPNEIASTQCSVEAVRFADGTIWKSPT